MFYYGVIAISKLISLFAFIYLSFWSLQSLNLEVLFKKGHNTHIKVLYILISICLGYIANEFFFEVIELTRNVVISAN